MSHLHRQYRNRRTYMQAQARYDAMAPAEDDEETWQECESCAGNDINCWRCDGQGGYVGAECMSEYEFNRRKQRLSEDRT